MESNDKFKANIEAITYPQNSHSQMEVCGEQPRQPRNLQGLLKFAMEATKAEDAPGNSTMGPMDDERKIFLAEALKSLTVDVAALLQNGIKILTNLEKIKSIGANDSVPEEVNEAFYSILSVVDDMDIANDFYKLGGFATFPVCYSCEHPEVKAQASNLIAELCQNDPYCQSKALECGLLGILVNILEHETHPLLLTKSLYALSCIVREFLPGVQSLLQTNGCAILVRLLNHSEIKLRTKASFLISYLCAHHPEAKRILLKDGLVRQLIKSISEGKNESSEHLLGALRSIISQNEVLEQCRDPQLKLREILEKHLKCPDLVDYPEEEQYCQEILNEVSSS